MTSIASYRVYCQSCSEEAVIRRDEENETDWSIESLQSHQGKCPECKRNRTVVEETVNDSKDLTDLNGVGETVATRLNKKNIEEPSDAGKFSDEQLLSIKGVGKGTVDSLREASE